jgi:hypothetical protein
MDIFTTMTPSGSVSPRQELVKDVRVTDRVRSPHQMLKRIGVIVAGILYFLLAGYVFAANSSRAREYRDNCARCHAADAKGNGPDANSEPGYHPADLTEITKHHEDKFPCQEIYDVIEGDKRLPGHYNFNSPMPLSGLSFPEPTLRRGSSVAMQVASPAAAT